ncbi:virginiamycin B lyase [Marinobacter daqiaonensis]|uniref:Virginiamycin B lyase n=1 Tax=Marinobacter daqiaonensis TaxID=650891 RepID=A0A1I6HRH9_9GAMM|nr:lyase [Marinobacter daqiaonensis]SFR56998.1 virginiamycin B lyase [Marinobacter daqiaonensis]
MKSLYPLLAALLLALASTPVHADAPAKPGLKEWKVPWENTRPRDPFVGPAGNSVWFVGQAGDYVATLNPETGGLKRYRLDPGTGPHNVIADERGAFYAGNLDGHIGLIDPDSGNTRKFRLEGDGPRDVHTMAFDSNGDIWFTEQAGNRIGRLEVDEYDFRMYPVKSESARPYGLVVGPDDRPWATLFGTNRLATVDREGQLREIRLPRDDARPRRLDITDKGILWYVDYSGGFLGRLDTNSGEILEWPVPGGPNAYPYAMALDDQGRPWFVETGPSPNRLIGFDPESERFSDPAAVPSGGGTVRHMVFDPETRSFWFGTDTNTVVRASLQ